MRIAGGGVGAGEEAELALASGAVVDPEFEFKLEEKEAAGSLMVTTAARSFCSRTLATAKK